jgi:hypothetical protein
MTDLGSRARAEVEGLHRFFEQWFRGEGGDGQGDASPAFARVADALAEPFQIVFPSGNRASRQALLTELRGNHGSRRAEAGTFEILIDRIEVRWELADVCLLTYEEWQHASSGTTARLSSAVFQRHDAAPEGVVWLHVHECWLPGRGPAR